MKYKLDDIGNSKLHQMIIVSSILDIIYDQYQEVYNKILNTLVFLNLFIMILGCIYASVMNNILYMLLSLFIVTIVILANVKILRKCDTVHLNTKFTTEKMLDEMLSIYEVSVKADMIRRLQMYQKGNEDEY